MTIMATQDLAPMPQNDAKADHGDYCYASELVPLRFQWDRITALSVNQPRNELAARFVMSQLRPARLDEVVNWEERTKKYLRRDITAGVLFAAESDLLIPEEFDGDINVLMLADTARFENLSQRSRIIGGVNLATASVDGESSPFIETAELESGDALPATVATAKNVIIECRYDTDNMVDLDFSAFLLDRNGVVRSEGDFVFFNQIKSADGSVRHLGDSVLDYGERIKIDSDKISDDVATVVFAVTVYSSRFSQNLSAIRGLDFRVIDAASGEELKQFNLWEIKSTQAALLVAELDFRSGDGFSIKPIEGGYADNLEALCQRFGVKV